jgi:hypothetical protein
MKKKGPSSKAVFTVACPTCGVAAGKRCILTTGKPRIEAHVNRRLSALEMLERKAGTNG